MPRVGNVRAYVSKDEKRGTRQLGMDPSQRGSEPVPTHAQKTRMNGAPVMCGPPAELEAMVGLTSAFQFAEVGRCCDGHRGRDF